MLRSAGLLLPGLCQMQLQLLRFLTLRRLRPYRGVRKLFVPHSSRIQLRLSARVQRLQVAVDSVRPKRRWSVRLHQPMRLVYWRLQVAYVC